MNDVQPRKRDGAQPRPQMPGPVARPQAPSPRQHASNPFLNEEEFVLPHVPDCDEWHYCWIRYRLGKDEDIKNLNRYLTGKLPYEIVTGETLPQSMKDQYSHLKIAEGTHHGRIGIGDVILGRCRRDLYELYIKATQIRADNMTGALEQTVNDLNAGDRRGRLYVEEDSEREGVMPGRADNSAQD